MTQKHPITPPPELVQQWDDEGTEMFRPEYQQHLTTRAAQWGADQELEACCEWLGCVLRSARRPKPPSLKEQALEALGRFSVTAHANADEMMADFELLRRAVEQLP